MAAKDMLRGLRHELERLKVAGPSISPLPARSIDMFTGVFDAVDRIASAGEHLARDLLFMKRDESRHADFFDPRASLADDFQAGHRFVRSRYGALKLILTRLVDEPALISESKIAEALSSLPYTESDNAAKFESLFTLALAKSVPISLAKPDAARQNELNRLAALIIGLAGVVAKHETDRAAPDLPELLSLCTDIVNLRQARLLQIFDGPAPDAILASLFDEFADALKDF
jgi:hypothetical protein